MFKGLINKRIKIVNYKLVHYCFLLIFIIITTGCVASYKAVGYSEDYNEVFVGEVNANLLSGSGTFKLEGQITGIKCEGASTVTYTPNPFTCVGQRGEIFGRCSDGRTLQGSYVVTSCTTGYGRGVDSMGNKFIFNFGLSEEEAEAQVRQRLHISQEKPPLPEYQPLAKNQQEKDDTKTFKTGTGFFISSNGYILTCYHVIKGANNIKILTYDKNLYDGFLVTKDSANDIAIIKIEANYPQLDLGKSNKISKGAEVMTLGYPLILLQGQEIKATFGRINALSGIGNDPRFFQIDVPVQPGNSGGPLIDLNGKVIGIIIGRLNEIEVFKIAGSIPQNANYAIKIDYASPLLDIVGNNLNTIHSIKDRGFKNFEEIIPAIEKSIVLVIAE